MAVYKSRFKGSQVDEAVTIANSNLDKGSNDTPIYYDSEGLAKPIEKDTTATVSSVKPLTSGGAYTGLNAVVDYSDIQTSTSLGTSDMPPSQNAVKQYVDNSLPAKQDTLYGGYGIDVNGATVSVSDDVFREDEEARLHADLKVDHFGDVSVGNDSEVLELMNEAKHSTFDSTKFTKVGSPNITNDGIASGFSTGNYLTFNNDLSNITKWEMNFKFNSGDLGVNNTNKIYNIIGSTTGRYFVCQGFSYSATYDRGCLKVLVGNGSDFVTTLSTDGGYLQENTNYWVKIIFDNGSYAYKISTNGDDYTTIRTGTGTTITSASFSIGLWQYVNTNPFTGSIDLKQFSITVDGVEVFSGNKTGIDAIKPDAYASVPSTGATFTLTEDGILSNTDNSNYLAANKLITYNSATNNLKIKFKCKTPSSDIALEEGNVRAIYWSQGNNRLTFNKNGYMVLEIGGSNYLPSQGAPNTKYYNENVDVEIICEGRKQTLKVTLSNGTVLTSSLTANADFGFDSSAYIHFGQGILSTWMLMYGANLDLNSFRVYVDDELVYQPCLKIPYTQTKDGKKIVDSIYRDRVEDEYTQAGFTPYYTLSDTDYTMATVEEDDIVASLDGATSYTQRADLSIEQQGTTTSGTAVTFPKAFMDTNYALSIPYSAKTKTGFTAAADGDYIAEGYTSL